MPEPRRRGKELAKKASSADGVTLPQYQVGLDMMRSNASLARIMATTGMTKAQVQWCTLKGNASMPPWLGVLEREYAVLRAKSLEVISNAGMKVAEIIQREFQIAGQAQDAITLLVSTYITQHLAVELTQSKSNGEVADLVKASMPTDMRETLKVLHKLKDTAPAMKAIATVYGTVNDLLRDARSTGASKDAGKVLAPDAHLPAAVALTEERQEAGGADLDPVETLLGDDLERWNDDDLQDFLNRPREDISETLKKYKPDEGVDDEEDL